MPDISDATSHTEGTTAPRPDAAPLRAVELVLIAVVWSFYGAMNVATEVLDRRWGTPAGADSVLLLQLFVNPAVWTLLTALVLWVSRRASLDRAFWRRRAALIVIAGVLVANVSDLVSDAIWDALAPAHALADGARGGPPQRFRPGFDNFSWLDDLAVFLSALGVATARGFVLRERARREEARRREADLEAQSARMQADAAQLQAQLAEARLDALRRQLDPHFLFNTLNAVSAFVERDPAGVRRMIGQLSDLLRHSMDDASSPEIPLRRELELLERYVDIMRVRFEGQLEVAFRVDPATLDALVPNLILQPTVENAIRHGVEQRADGGRVEVRAVVEGNALVLRVRDNGPGTTAWSAAAVQASAGGQRGVGLRNTAARLAALYGANQRFTVGPDPAGGTLAEVRLPYHTSASAKADVERHEGESTIDDGVARG